MEFTKFPKIARFNRDWIVTEKINGTTAAVVIGAITRTADHPDAISFVFAADEDPCDLCAVYAQSRNRFVTPGDDNFGFAAWVERNADTLVDDLGPGTHFGEWAGPGIQGNPHKLDERAFFLFNVSRWWDFDAWEPNIVTDYGLTVVPVFDVATDMEYLQHVTRVALSELRRLGSIAKGAATGKSSDYEIDGTTPEGIVVYSKAAGVPFKILLENDELPKSVAEAVA